MEWLWLFYFYSFLGYLLERMFAKITASPRQVRKGFLLLPLCPAYGLAMVADLAAADLYALSGLALFWRGMGIATVVEYLTHLFYDRVLGVSFWDYTGVPGCLGRGRICLPFSLVWGVLSAGAAVLFQPLLAPLARRMPHYKEAVVVNLADKLCATVEVLQIWRRLKLRRTVAASAQ